MSNNIRRRMFSRRTKALFVVFVLGAAGIGMLLILTPNNSFEGVIPERGGSLIMKLRSGWAGWAVVGSVFTSLLTVSIYELLTRFLHVQVWRMRDLKKFNAFFGDNAAEQCGAGEILLQSDSIDALLIDYGLRGFGGQPIKRFYKARHWVNFFDTEGAQAIAKGFRDFGLDSPKVLQVARGARSRNVQAPFTVTMGLAYSDATVERVQKWCKGWMRIVRNDTDGDGVELLHNLVPDRLARLAFQDVQVAATDSESGKRESFRRILPNPWDHQKWLENDGTIHDYAIILRQTDVSTSGVRRVTFALAGFTERGTAAAGEYLATYWKDLWSEHVKDRHQSGDYGDFLLIIEGPSHYQEIEHWAPDPNLRAITPARLRDLAPQLHG